MKSQKYKVNEIMYAISMILLMLIAVNIILTAVLLICNISVSAFNFPLSIVITYLIWGCLISKHTCIKDWCWLIGGSLFIILSSLILCRMFYDISWDGNAYHKLATGCLAYGWNPNYQTIEEFFSTSNLEHSAHYSATWPNLFPKGSWLFASSIYKATGSIECGKIINILSVVIVFIQSFYSFDNVMKSNIKRLCFSLILALNPIVCSQIFTYYIDGALANFLFVMLINLYSLSYEQDKPGRTQIISLFCTIVICSNLKFTGLAMAGVFCFSVFIFWMVRIWKDLELTVSEKQKKTIRVCLFYFVTVCVAVLIVGSSSYVKNTVLYHNPVYMVFGKDSVEMMKGMQPECFEQYSSYQKLFCSIFSKTEHLLTDQVCLKIPFTFSKEEFYNESTNTLRGGFGPFFSGVVICSLIIIAYEGCRLIKQHSKYVPFLVSMLCSVIFLAGIMDTCWVARYAPFVYIIPAMAIGLTENFKNKIWSICLSIFLLCLLLVDSFTFARGSIRDCYIRTNMINDSIESIGEKSSESQGIEIFVDNQYQFEGALFDLRDWGIEYHLSKDNEGLDDYLAPYHIYY